MSYLLWVIIAVAALFIDIVTSSFLFVWFTVGGIAAIIVSIMHGSFAVQLIVFLVVSAIFMAVGYPIIKKTIKKTVPRTLTMEENYIGRKFTADDDMINKASIKFNGIYWTMKNEGEPIKKGDKVLVTGIEGNKLLVKKI